MYRVICLISLVLMCGDAISSPDPEQLILRYFRDCGQYRNNGKFDILQQVYHPYYPKEVFAVPGGLYGGANGKVDDEKEKKRYYQRMAQMFDINFNSSSKEYSYEASRCFYDGEKKRKDRAILDSDYYHQLLDGKMAFTEAPFEKYYDNGSNKLTAILDQGINEKDPQVAITPAKLGIPRVHQFGKSRGTPKTAKLMVDLIQSGKYRIFGEMTQEGYLATAEADETMAFSKLELVFSEKDGDYVLKETRQYRMGHLYDEEHFDDYITMPDGSSLPTKIVTRRYSPFPVSIDGGVPEYKVVYEQKVTVLNAEFNTIIPEDTFLPHIPYGATVFDTTVDPPIQFEAYEIKDSDGKDFFLSSIDAWQEAVEEKAQTLVQPLSISTSLDAISNPNEPNNGEIIVTEQEPKAKIERMRLPLSFYILVVSFFSITLYRNIRKKLSRRK